MRFLLPHTIDHSATRFPDQDAFRCRDSAITYADLSARTNRLAHLLIDLGVRQGDRVGVRLPRSIDSAVAVHGIMKSGAAFVPVDPWLPDTALAKLIDDCGLQHLITHEIPGDAAAAKLRTVIGSEPRDGQPAVIPWSALEQFPGGQSPPVSMTEHDLAYIMYTSGSTGRPKGIMHTHRSGLSYAELSVTTYDVQPEDRIGNHSPLHFDMSTFGYFSGPLAGATTVIIPEEHTKLPASLAQLIEKERISIWYSVPSPLIQLLQRGAIERRDLTSLRWIKYGGEPFPLKHLRALMTAWPHATFSNVYGPAEVNQCTWHHVTESDVDSGRPIPIGRVWDNTEAMVIDENDQPVQPGDSGELVVRSATMMQGYWNQEELTARSFLRYPRTAGIDRPFYRTGDLVQLLADGEYVFLGRRDRQIKTRGHRVELDDVEAALVSCEDVIESAAWPIADGEGSRMIEAAVILQADSEIPSQELMRHAKQTLPPYAVPFRIEVRSDFPRTPTGKVDRRELQRQSEAGQDARLNPQPSTASPDLIDVSQIQQTLTSFIVNELLGGSGDGVAADENLLLTGKVDSIGMMRLVAFVEEEFGFSVPAEDVTIENFMSIDAMTIYIDRHINA